MKNKMKHFELAFLVCSFLFTSVLSETTTAKESLETEPSTVERTSLTSQNAVSHSTEPPTSQHSLSTGKLDQAMTTEEGTQSASQATNENAIPGGTQTDDISSPNSVSTSGPQSESPPTTGNLDQSTQATGTQVTDAPNSTVKEEGQPTNDGNDATTATDGPDAPSVSETSKTDTTTKQQTTTLAVPTAAPKPKPEKSFDLTSFLGGVLVVVSLILIGLALYCCSKCRKKKPYERMD